MELHTSRFVKSLRCFSSKAFWVLTICFVLLYGMLGMRNTMQIVDSKVPLAAGLKSINAGDTVTVKVYAEQVSDLYGYQLKVNFDETVLEYQGLRSSIPEISLIFQKQFPGYLLIGATKIGEEQGYSATDGTPVCEVVFKAVKDGVIPGFSISEVNVINSLLEYEEDVPDWSFELAYTG